MHSKHFLQALLFCNKLSTTKTLIQLRILYTLFRFWQYLGKIVRVQFQYTQKRHNVDVLNILHESQQSMHFGTPFEIFFCFKLIFYRNQLALCSTGTVSFCQMKRKNPPLSRASVRVLHCFPTNQGWVFSSLNISLLDILHFYGFTLPGWHRWQSKMVLEYNVKEEGNGGKTVINSGNAFWSVGSQHAV